MLTTLKVYLSFECKQPLEAISKLNRCLADIRRWMITNKLMINDSKTEFIVFMLFTQQYGCCSTLNSYLYVHWILDFKYILLLLLYCLRVLERVVLHNTFF